MSKQYLKFGFAETVDKGYGVYKEVVTEKFLFCQIIRNSKRYSQGEKINDNIELGNEFSVILDPWMKENFSKIRYVSYMGTRWRINNAEINYPRINFSLGGVYNGPEPESV